MSEGPITFYNREQAYLEHEMNHRLLDKARHEQELILGLEDAEEIINGNWQIETLQCPMTQNDNGTYCFPKTELTGKRARAAAACCEMAKRLKEKNI